jgi:hypothetical protein
VRIGHRAGRTLLTAELAVAQPLRPRSSAVPVQLFGLASTILTRVDVGSLWSFEVTVNVPVLPSMVKSMLCG